MRSIFALLLLLMLPGCALDARNEVVRNVNAIDSYDHRSPAVVRDPVVDGYIDTLGEGVLAAALRYAEDSCQFRGQSKRKSSALYPYDEFEVRVVHSEYANATTPGDNVARLSSAFVLQAGSAEEICAVLCHEMGHLMHQHAFEERMRFHTQEFQSNTLIALGAVVDVAAIALGSPVIGSPATGAAMNSKAQRRAEYSPFEKTDEFEADEVGYHIYREMGLDPFYYDDFLMRTMTEYGDTGSPSHPKPSERVERIRKLRVAEGEYRVKRRIDPREFAEIQRRLATVVTQVEPVDMRPGENERAYRFAIPTEEEIDSTMAQHGYRRPHLYACGCLFNVDPEDVRSNYRRALRKHGR